MCGVSHFVMLKFMCCYSPKYNFVKQLKMKEILIYATYSLLNCKHAYTILRCMAHYIMLNIWNCIEYIELIL